MITQNTFMYIIGVLFFISLGISMFFRDPLERLMYMLFELQIILHMPILEVTFPGNIVTMFNIFLPLAKFDYLGFMVGGKFINSVDDAEENLEYLG